MILKELLDLEDGVYKMHLSDLSVYSYLMKVETDKKTGTYEYKKWISITLSAPQSIHDVLIISQRVRGLVLFSCEPAFGLTVTSEKEPSWFEYFQHTLDELGNKIKL